MVRGAPAHVKSSRERLLGVLGVERLLQPSYKHHGRTIFSRRALTTDPHWWPTANGT